MKTALTIAGSDCSGGAGIQADLKTMTVNGVFGMSAITALTAQNTTGVSDIFAVSPAFLAEQIDMVFADIRPDATKIGMVADTALIPKTPFTVIVFKSAWIPAPPLQSLPAMVNAVFIMAPFSQHRFITRRKVVPPIHRGVSIVPFARTAQ